VDRSLVEIWRCVWIDIGWVIFQFFHGTCWQSWKTSVVFLLITVFSINTPFCCFESSRKLFWFFGGPFFLSILKKAMQSGQNGHHLLELFRRVLKQVFDNEVSTSYILFLNSWDIWGLPKPFLKKNWLGVPNWSRDFKLQAFLSCHIYTYYSVFL